MATLIVTKTDFDIEIPETCNTCMFVTWDDSEYGDHVCRCLLLKSDEDDEYSELNVEEYCSSKATRRCPRCPIISMERNEA